MIQSNDTTNLTYALDQFPKSADNLVASYVIRGMNLRDLQLLFGAQEDDLLDGCWPVREAHAKRLALATGHNLDLENFDYFVGGFRPESISQ